MNLHEIDDQIAAVLQANINEETGEINLAALEQLEVLDLTREQKILSCGRHIRDHEEQAVNLADRVKLLQHRKKIHEADAQWLRAWVGYSCEAGEELEDEDIKLSFRKTTKVEARNIDDVPLSLIIFGDAPAPKLDKAKAKEWIKMNGEVPPGVDEIKARSLQIK